MYVSSSILSFGCVPENTQNKQKKNINHVKEKKKISLMRRRFGIGSPLGTSIFILCFFLLFYMTDVRFFLFGVFSGTQPKEGQMIAAIMYKNKKSLKNLVSSVYEWIRG